MKTNCLEKIETNVYTIALEPGNGTRYEIMYYWHRDMLYFVLENFNRMCVFGVAPGTFAQDYLTEKLGVNSADADALIPFIKELFDTYDG